MKRISFSKKDASHIYEWLIMYWVNDPLGPKPNRFGGCYICETHGKRLEKLIGLKEAARIRKLCKNHPGGTR